MVHYTTGCGIMQIPERKKMTDGYFSRFRARKLMQAPGVTIR